jgi:hypothetical protein
MSQHDKSLAMVWGSAAPARSIGYERERMTPSDSGFTVLFDDAPDPEEAEQSMDHVDIAFVCLSCLVDDHPEIGRGLDLAFEYGVADLSEDGEWVVGDLSRLEIEI